MVVEGLFTMINDISLVAHQALVGGGVVAYDSPLSNVYGPSSASLNTSTTGDKNIALGQNALQKNTTGIYNVAIGYEAHQENLDGGGNVSVGYQALKKSTTNSGNTAIGTGACIDLSGGTHNTALGYQAGALNVNGWDNVTLGFEAAWRLVDSSYNVAVGPYALAGAVGSWASRNVAVGYEAMSDASGASLNVAIGAYAMKLTTTGDANTAIGFSALRYNTTGIRNVGMGTTALRQNQGGSFNTVLGYGAVVNIVDSSHNVAIGYSALTGLVGSWASRNVAIGSEAMKDASGAYNNVAIGFQAARDVSDCSGLLVLNATGRDFPNAAEITAAGGAPAAAQDRFYVKPVREASQSSALYYNPGSGEVTYDASGSASSGPGGTSFSSGFMMEPIHSAEGSSDSAITNLDVSTNPLMTNGLLWVSKKKNSNFNWSSGGVFPGLRIGSAVVWNNTGQGYGYGPGTTSCVIGGKWYIFGCVWGPTVGLGGAQYYNLSVFNPVTNTIDLSANWEAGSIGSDNDIPGFECSPPGGGITLRSVNVRGKMYIFQGGGYSQVSSDFQYRIFGSVLDPSCAITSANTDCFTPLPYMETNGVGKNGTTGFSCTLVNDIIFVIGGVFGYTGLSYFYYGAGGHVRCLNTTTWSPGPDASLYPAAAAAAAAAAWYDPYPNKLLFLGPTDGVNALIVAGYAPGPAPPGGLSTRSVAGVDTALQYGCAYHNAVNINGKIYIFGGLWASAWNAALASVPYNKVQILEPETGCVELVDALSPANGRLGTSNKGTNAGIDGNVGGTTLVAGNTILWLGGYGDPAGYPIENISPVPTTTPYRLLNTMTYPGIIDLSANYDFMFNANAYSLGAYPVAAVINNRVYYASPMGAANGSGNVTGTQIIYFDLSMNSLPMVTLQGEDLYLTASRGGPKTFIIPHPEYEGKMLRHACLEAPTRGTNVYEYQIEVKEPNHTTTIPLPSYFKHINGRGRVYVSAVQRSACGEIGGYVNTDLTAAIIETERTGTFNVMVTGVRKDPEAVAYSEIEDIDAPIAIEDIPNKK